MYTRPRVIIEKANSLTAAVQGAGLFPMPSYPALCNGDTDIKQTRLPGHAVPVASSS